MYACLLFVFAALQTIFLSKYFREILITGLRVKAALTSVIYKKVDIKTDVDFNLLKIYYIL